MQTAVHTFLLERPVIKNDRTGTRTIYKAVRNPAFPTSVYPIEICCRVDPRHRKKPQVMPPMIDVRRLYGALT